MCWNSPNGSQSSYPAVPSSPTRPGAGGNPLGGGAGGRNPLAKPAILYAGTWQGAELKLELNGHPNMTGALDLSGSLFEVTATEARPGRLEGNFQTPDGGFAFVAEAEGDTMHFETDGRALHPAAGCRARACGPGHLARRGGGSGAGSASAVGQSVPPSGGGNARAVPAEDSTSPSAAPTRRWPRKAAASS